MRKQAVFAALLGAIAVGAERGRATSVAPMTLVDLARVADTIVHARVAKVDVAWGQHLERPAIVTTYVLTDEVALEGQPLGALQAFGGEVGGMRMRLAGQPTLRAGDEVVLFVTRGAWECPFVGVWQGVYVVRDGRVTREERPVVDVVAHDPQLGGDSERGLTRDAFLAEVARAIEVAAKPVPVAPPAECVPCDEQRKTAKPAVVIGGGK